ncbi:siderophore-interacting protein [Bosea sp. NPDC003192]|uniref:siderophore-interacting protein n=1 Tax=Bosea sp. NPDC003192 TaxID=3390551 RepID=UPI003D03B00B
MTVDGSFRWMRVAASTRLAPRMQRLRLEGKALGRFATNSNLHVRLHVPAGSGERFAQPSLDGRPVLSPDMTTVATRYYTIRRIDATQGWVEIDFVLHEAPGPAGDFARFASPGDICGMSGPCGLGIKPAGYYLLAGDETALPAIARIAEGLQASARGAIFIEVDTPEDRLLLTIPPDMSCRWICRRENCASAEADFIAQVEQAIAMTAAGPADHFVWIAAEFGAYEALRRPLKAIAKSRSICVPYWRAGEAA